MHPDQPNPLVRAILAIGSLALIFGIVFALIFHKIPVGNSDLLGAVLGQMMLLVGAIAGFYFHRAAKEKAKEKATEAGQ